MDLIKTKNDVIKCQLFVCFWLVRGRFLLSTPSTYILPTITYQPFDVLEYVNGTRESNSNDLRIANTVVVILDSLFNNFVGFICRARHKHRNDRQPISSASNRRILKHQDLDEVKFFQHDVVEMHPGSGDG